MATELKRRTGIPLRDAAEVLKISPDAVRMRIKRGSLEAYKEDGQWRVVLPEQPEQNGERVGEQAEQPTERVHEQPEQTDRAPIEQLQSEVAFLREELTSRRDAERELRVLLARLGDRIEELPAPLEQAELLTDEEIEQFRKARFRRLLRAGLSTVLVIVTLEVIVALALVINAPDAAKSLASDQWSLADYTGVIALITVPPTFVFNILMWFWQPNRA